MVNNWRDPDSLRGCKTLLALLLGLVLATAVVAAVDVLLGRLAKASRPEFVWKNDFSRTFQLPDSNLGYRIESNFHGVSSMEVDGLQIYEVEYTSGDTGWRITPTNDISQRHKKFLLFFGGSFTFGTGVENRETLPSRTALLAQDYHVYNYSNAGYGPSHMLAMLEAGEISSQVQERQGIAIYVLRPGHVVRVVGAMGVTTKWAGRFPYYALDQQNDVVRMGNFDDRRVLKPLYFFLSRRGIVRFAHLDIPLVLKKRHFLLTSRVIQESKNILEHDFDSVDFYVVVYPALKQRWPHIAPVVSFLEAAGVSVLDYRDLLDLESGKYFIHKEFERHPSPKSYQEVAARLVSDLVFAAD